MAIQQRMSKHSQYGKTILTFNAMETLLVYFPNKLK